MPALAAAPAIRIVRIIMHAAAAAASALDVAIRQSNIRPDLIDLDARIIRGLLRGLKGRRQPLRLCVDTLINGRELGDDPGGLVGRGGLRGLYCGYQRIVLCM